jgi:phytoene dehydrogenase-like protein
MPAIDFLRSRGFSEKIIQRFFRPFFAGVCLDPDIGASSRVFRHIFRVFSEGDVALPSRGMEAIAQQLAESLPEAKIRTGAKVASVAKREVVLNSGESVRGRAVVLATEGPETARLLKETASPASRGELCLYFSSQKPPVSEPFLILNGDGKGWVNSVTVPSVVAPSYSPDGRELISVVVIGRLSADDATVLKKVRQELTDWFGAVVEDWQHLKTIRIVHALPEQPSPMPDPTKPATAERHGIYVCGEYDSVPGIQWAMLSGRQTAEQIVRDHVK